MSEKEKDDSITCSSAMAQDRNSQITAAVSGDCKKGEENPPINNLSSASMLAAAELKGIWQENMVGVEYEPKANHLTHHFEHGFSLYLCTRNLYTGNVCQITGGETPLYKF